MSPAPDLLEEAQRRIVWLRENHGPDPGYPSRCRHPDCHYTRLPCDALDNADLIERLVKAVSQPGDE